MAGAPIHPLRRPRRWQRAPAPARCAAAFAPRRKAARRCAPALTQSTKSCVSVLLRCSKLAVLPAPVAQTAPRPRPLRSMKLDVNVLRYLAKEDFRVLTSVEMGQKNVSGGRAAPARRQCAAPPPAAPAAAARPAPAHAAPDPARSPAPSTARAGACRADRQHLRPQVSAVCAPQPHAAPAAAHPLALLCSCHPSPQQWP